MESKRNKQNSAPPCHDNFQVIGVPLFDNEMIALAGKNGANISKQKSEELIKWVFQSTDLKCIGDKEAQIRFLVSHST
jgi:hypothetical protein